MALQIGPIVLDIHRKHGVEVASRDVITTGIWGIGGSFGAITASIACHRSNGWTRRRLRCVVWVQWKTRGQRYRELLKAPERSASAAIRQPMGL
jgi:hypothetical protein